MTDYIGVTRATSRTAPKPAIDAFTNLFAEELNIVHVGYQLVVQKKG